MKIAVSGKGGVGKTTISSLLCHGLDARGREVIAIDADSNPNLARALGMAAFEEITPLAEMEDLILEKTGAKRGSYGVYFRMNPDVSDIPERFRHPLGNIQLLVMGSITRGNAGCACPEYVLIRSLISYLLLNKDQDMVIDMEAGLEHLGRGVTEKVDVLLIVVRPDKVSCLTACRIHELAKQIGIRNVFAIGNEIRNGHEKDYVQSQIKNFEFLGFFPESDAMRACERQGKSVSSIAELKESATTLIYRIAEIQNA